MVGTDGQSSDGIRRVPGLLVSDDHTQFRADVPSEFQQRNWVPTELPDGGECGCWYQLVLHELAIWTGTANPAE